MRTAALVLSFALATGCKFDPSGVDNNPSVTTDGSIDTTPSIDANGDAPDAPPCTPGCDGTDLVTCPGGVEQRTTCALGCSASGGNHCQQIVPSNGANLGQLAGVVGNIVLDATFYEINTDTGLIIQQSGAPVVIRASGQGFDSNSGTFFTNLSGTVSVLTRISPAVAACSISTTRLHAGPTGSISKCVAPVRSSGFLRPKPP